MKFLLDNCVSRQVAELLSSQGHEVERVANWGYKATDEQVLRHAQDHRQILITLDKDFGRLVELRLMQHCGVIRLLVNRPANQTRVVSRLLTLHEAELGDKLVVAGLSKVRIRKGSSSD